MVQLRSPETDQRITVQGSWEKFKLIEQGLADSPGTRLTFHAGTIEILMPGQAHEYFSRIIGFLVMTYFLEKGIRFKPTGSVTQEKLGEASAQADESFCLGDFKPIPDLAIEVVYSSGGVSKLAKYQALGVREVWFWEDGTLSLHHLPEQGYERVERSGLPGLEQLDIDLLRRCILLAEGDEAEAVQMFRKGIRESTQ
ncbi:MAG: Uma2 family endonuclease [Synechococcales cyanobacterium RM1_1_8]|nr:Uma2 family endonuclease [Synechococcales cyanobacterium RM1_1_8]